MCGREASFYTWREVVEFSRPLRFDTPSLDPQPNYNRAPSQKAWVIVAEHHQAYLRELSWGLVPAWAGAGKVSPSVNARVETAAEKPSFRAAWQHRRCLIPSSGYYEWQQFARKQPYFIRAAHTPILMYAGLWERNEKLGLTSYCILTQAAHGPIARVHDRMPVMLGAELLSDWLYGSSAQAARLVAGLTPPELDFYPVSLAVGNVRNQGSDLIARIAPIVSDDLFGA
jgi:putative SOS response-associated peptidase YedK